MNNLNGKRIVLGISGSIAAYKTPELVRQLIKAGAEVKVICTDAATNFVSNLALSTVSKNPVLSKISDADNWNNHVALGRWADALLIAPCSANTLGKLANGLCDNLLCAVYLSANCPVFIAPAMDEDMWQHGSTKNNLNQLKEIGNNIIPVAHGELASGLVGEGRMAEPENIVAHLANYFENISNQKLQHKKALVTAGPTFERIDPVRFIGNFSTGKMGIALAESLANEGASVTLVLGPTHLRSQHPRIKTILVESADEMFEACVATFAEMDIAIMAAAVADYRPKNIATEKIKKTENALDIVLEKNKDILAHLGTLKKEHQTLVGFALETKDEIENATKKLINKNADFIILNSLRDEGAGFGGDTNKVVILQKNAAPISLPLQSKTDTAKEIIAHIIQP